MKSNLFYLGLIKEYAVICVCVCQACVSSHKLYILVSCKCYRSSRPVPCLPDSGDCRISASRPAPRPAPASPCLFLAPLPPARTPRNSPGAAFLRRYNKSTPHSASLTSSRRIFWREENSRKNIRKLLMQINCPSSNKSSKQRTSK